MVRRARCEKCLEWVAHFISSTGDAGGEESLSLQEPNRVFELRLEEEESTSVGWGVADRLVAAGSWPFGVGG